MRTPRHPMLTRLGLLGALTVLIVPTAAGVAAQADRATATFHGNAARTGEQPGPAPKGNEATLAWKFQTGDAVRSSPVIERGVIYVGSNDRNFYAIDAKTGEEKWRFAAGGPIQSTAVVADRAVYFGTHDGYVYALDAAKGELRWKFYAGGRPDFRLEDLEGETDVRTMTPDPLEASRQSPVLATALSLVDGTLYVSSNDFILYAIDPETGIERWHNGAVGAQLTSVAIDNGAVVVGTEKGLIAFDVANGNPLWDGTWPNKPNQKTDPVEQAEDGIITVSEFFNSDEFKGEWTVTASPVTVGDTTYAVGYVFDTVRKAEAGLLLGLDAATGGVKSGWIFYGHGHILTTPAIVDGTAYVGSDQGFFYAVDIAGTFVRDGAAAPTAEQPEAEASAVELTTMVEKWGVQTGPQVYIGSSPAVVGDQVFFATQGGGVYSLNAETGVQNWLFTTDGPVWSSPAVENGLVFIGSDDGYLYALGAK